MLARIGGGRQCVEAARSRPERVAHRGGRWRRANASVIILTAEKVVADAMASRRDQGVPRPSFD